MILKKLDLLLVQCRSINTKKEEENDGGEKKSSDRMIGDSLCGAGPDGHEAVQQPIGPSEVHIEDILNIC
jgi:hypothetical protein